MHIFIQSVTNVEKSVNKRNIFKPLCVLLLLNTVNTLAAIE